MSLPLPSFNGPWTRGELLYIADAIIHPNIVFKTTIDCKMYQPMAGIGGIQGVKSQPIKGSDACRKQYR